MEIVERGSAHNSRVQHVGLSCDCLQMKVKSIIDSLSVDCQARLSARLDSAADHFEDLGAGDVVPTT